MDALLPSEIARLVLGYLQEQKCEEAAKVFMESSPNLQECRIVAQRGGRYSTKVGGLSLVDILDKYCAANAMVQEKLNTVTDSEQLKNCNDLLEQLKYLLEGSRGHRFVVNINVPSQNTSSGAFSSPNASGGSARKRHYNSSERGKRAARSLNNLLENSIQETVNQKCNTVEATPLESLPGHALSIKQLYTENNVNIPNDKIFSNNELAIHGLNENLNTSAAIVTNTELAVNLGASNVNILNNNNTSSNDNDCNSSNNNKDQLNKSVQKDKAEQISNKCTAGTSTEELMSYNSAEVQTGPCDLIDSELEINNEPAENLSILTKKLLQRTELHERIAENINKAILPVETSFREDNTNEKAADTNTSLLTDFDNAIKSVVEATETDPVFEGFLHEIFKIGETDTSPDEDSDAKHNQGSNDQITSEPMEVDNGSEIIDPPAVKINNQENTGLEIPLKQRLRSSSRSQNPNIEEEEKDSNTLLDNQNAEAVMNIVNVIANRRNSLTSKESESEKKIGDNCKLNATNEKSTEKIESEKKVSGTKTDSKPKSTTKKSSIKRPKLPKPKPTPVNEKEVVPTLILCSDTDVGSLSHRSPTVSNFLPIAPKLCEEEPENSKPPPTIYLRTVNVPRHLATAGQVESSLVTPLIQKALQLKNPSRTLIPSNNSDNIVLPVIVTDESQIPSSLKSTTAESITLYGGENNIAEVKMSPISNIPIINLDDTMIGLSAGNGLSPFLKTNTCKEPLNNGVEDPISELNDQYLEKNVERSQVENKDKAEIELPISGAESNEPKKCEESEKINEAIIVKRTPRTLLKSRSKNNRLSLSTPRRRNSHVRALDFSTPIKASGGIRKVPQTCTRTKSVCRAGLFKSPPISNDTTNLNLEPSTVKSQIIKKVKTVTPVKNTTTYLHVPIATRSPIPKLQGNWGKVTGIGLILGETSASESSPEKLQPECLPPINELEKKPVVKVVAKKSWDEDLRKIVGNTVKEEVKKPRQRKRTAAKKKDEQPKPPVVNNATNQVKGKRKTKKNEVENEDDKNKTDSLNKTIENSELMKKLKEKIEITPPVPIVTKIPKKENNLIVNNKNISEDIGPTVRFPDMLDLETPRKTEVTVYIPPTPRLLNTPADNLIKTSRAKPSRDISIKDFVNTPDFPVTPCIVITPKVVEEDNNKKPSPYYEPQSPKLKAIVTTEKIVEKTTTLPVQKNVIELQENKMIEITKFGVVQEQSVIKEIEEDCHEEKYSFEEKNTSDEKDTSDETIIDEENAIQNTSVSTESDSDDSSDSSSSTTSSSSSSSSNSSTSSSSSCSNTTPSRDKSFLGSHESVVNNICTPESEIDCPETLLNNFSRISQEDIERVNKISKRENSPQKVFSLLKETSDESVKETPAKGENIPEAMISETPSVSEAERALRRDSLTNLTSKISAIVSTCQSNETVNLIKNSQKTEDRPNSENLHRSTASKPKIVNIKTILPTDGMAIELSKMLQLEIKNKPSVIEETHTSHTNLSEQLEEKRRRVLAKFKQNNLSKKNIDDIKQKKVAVKIISSTTDNLNSKTTQEPAVTVTQELVNKKENSLVNQKNVKENSKKTKSKSSPKKKAVQEKDRHGKAEKDENLNTKVEEETVFILDKKPATVNVASENTKGIPRSKVNLIKRDLFSDDEANEQRTTRSQAARRSIDNRKANDVNTSPDSSKEKIPGVLECLQLIPANKSDEQKWEELHLSDKSTSSANFSNNQSNSVQYSFVYDESVPIKKRKRKYSNSELENEYAFVIDDDIHILNVTSFEEIFKMAPKFKKKAQSPKKSPVKIKKSKLFDEIEQPIATSSPLIKVVDAKNSKSRSNEKKSRAYEKKSNKRKLSPVKEPKQIEKKSKPDPQALFNKIKIDEFLKSVHVPE